MKKKKQRIYLLTVLLMTLLALSTGCNLLSNQKSDSVRTTTESTTSPVTQSNNSFVQPDTKDKIAIQTQFDLFTDSFSMIMSV